MSNLRSSVVAALGALSLMGGVALAQQATEFKPDAGGQITFVTPSGNVGCTFTPKGATGVYKPADGGPELSCDRREPKYVRVVMTPKSVKRFDDVGDRGCCDASNPLPYGARWSHESFVCESANSGLTCKRNDGRGFTISRERVETF